MIQRGLGFLLTLLCAFPANSAFVDLPLTMTVRQRSYTPVPGSRESVFLGIGDITAGQVLTHLQGPQNETLLSTESMSPGRCRSFRFAGAVYTLLLSHLDNALIGEDFATFQIDAAGPGALPAENPRLIDDSQEAQRIEALIQFVAALKDQDVAFLRNGVSFTPARAAEHLRSKLSSGTPPATAVEFIDKFASVSSQTGQPYQLRYSDGHTVDLGPVLHDALAGIIEAQ